ncbi:hypothetical protein OAO86_01715 [Euryarchaeota archaeon]|nr:hypothetical protein [Euryarchaeota archaeon]
MAEDTDFGIFIAVLLAIPIVMIFFTGFGLIFSTKDDTSMISELMEL